ncbi:hypothetical protein BDZ97DRAFT_1993886 [Flammula alnicola]|nr:hypothetical protein BDZ97DRAFT_1993886 [Flammula alnicola]
MLPVNRLATYQDLFARMLDLTPKSHQDYLSTFSLSRSTDMVIRVMTEVKIREDEYNLLKAFSSRIQGLSSSNDLATRERRLLHSGPLAVSDFSPTSEGTFNPSSHGQTTEASRAKRGSRLLDAISTSSSTIFERSDSVKSTSTGNSFSSDVPATSTPVKSSNSWFSRLPLRKRSRSKSPLPMAGPTRDHSDLQHSPPTALRTVSVHAFVFNDLVLLAQPSQTSGHEPQWILSKDLGIFRPLSIARIQTRNNEGTILSLEAMVLDSESLNEDTDFRTTSFRTVDVVLPRQPYEHANEDSVDLFNNEAFQQAWLMAFRQCTKTTLRKLTFLGVGHQDDLFNNSDQTLDTRLAVSSLVGSGLPIPRSPSGTFPDMRGGGDNAFWGDEREERGWWSLRYQQIFREFQRQDSLLSDDDGSVGM